MAAISMEKLTFNINYLLWCFSSAICYVIFSIKAQENVCQIWSRPTFSAKLICYDQILKSDFFVLFFITCFVLFTKMAVIHVGLLR